MNDTTAREQPLAPFGAAWPPTEAMADAVAQFWTTLAGLNTELTRFAQTRISHTNDSVGRLFQCQTLPDAFAAESEWLRTAFEDWADEARRVAEINSRLMGCLMPLTRQSAPGARP